MQEDAPPSGAPPSSAATPATTPTQAHATAARGGFGRGFWIAILTLAVIVGGAQWGLSRWITEEAARIIQDAPPDAPQATQGPAAPTAPPPPPPKVRLKRELIERSFKAGEERLAAAQEEMREEIRAEFSSIRAHNERLIKGWADWYYSVTGEYSRLASLAVSWGAEQMGREATGAVERYMQEQVKARLIDPLGADERIERLEASLRGRLKGVSEEMIQETRLRLNETLAEAEARGVVHEEDLNFLKQRSQALEQLNGFHTLTPLALTSKLIASGATGVLIKGAVKGGVAVAAKTGAKTGAKAGQIAVAKAGAKAGMKVGQAVVTKVASKGLIKSAAALWTKLLMKFGLKTASKAGAAGAAAATGTASCAFLGLGALACGAVAGTVTWFAVDKVVVEVDEYFTRDQFEADLRRDLNASWGEVESDLISALDDHVGRVQLMFRAPLDQGGVQRETTLMEVMGQ